ncbi:MAG: BMP family ABC transporter substrate-binding protein [Candidatus Acetothermia bacterium]|jgi:basic membrane protein A|nr:BMP family ABC transporter substrate-binding protein [Candidatus Acetothermia bacterium]
MRKGLLWALLMVLGVAVAFGSIPKIGLILATGGLGDRSFNDQSYWGAERAAKELAAKYGVPVEQVFSYVEPRSIADYEAFQREFARSGEYTIIVCIGFDQAPVLEEVAPDYPNQWFVVIDAVAAVGNVASIVFNDWEEAFLCGVVAGLWTKTGKVGVEGGMDIPLIRRFVQGFTQGAMWANPAITEGDVLVRYVGAWNNPTLGKELALEMYQAGADVVYGAAGKSHLGVFAAAEEKPGVWWAIGTDVDQAWSTPEHADVIIASGLKRVDLAVYTEIMKAVEGTWAPGVISYGMAAEAKLGTGIAVGSEDALPPYVVASASQVAIPAEVVAKAVEAAQGILNGTIVIEHE